MQHTLAVGVAVMVALILVGLAGGPVPPHLKGEEALYRDATHVFEGTQSTVTKDFYVPSQTFKVHYIVEPLSFGGRARILLYDEEGKLERVINDRPGAVRGELLIRTGARRFHLRVHASNAYWKVAILQ